MRAQIVSLTLAMFFASTALAAPADSVAARLAAQNALFEEQYQSDLTSSPETATAYGDYRYNDQLDNVSMAEAEREHAVDGKFLARLKAISTDGFGEQDLLSHQLMVRMLEQRNEDYTFKDFEMPLSQMSGAHTDLADLPLSSPFSSVKYYEDYISRLHQVPRVFTQTEEVLRQGLKDNLMPVRFLLEKIPAQCQGVVASNPFLLPTNKFASNISAADQQRLTQQITDVVNKEVLPACKAFGGFVSTQYAPHGRTALAVSSLAGGEARYRHNIRDR